MPAAPHEVGHRVVCHLDHLLAARGMTLTELADRVGITVVNLSILKNGRAKAVRFSTLTLICDALGCQPGDLFSVIPQPTAHQHPIPPPDHPDHNQQVSLGGATATDEAVAPRQRAVRPVGVA
jgi:putative transcriptional regulator